MHPRPPSLLTRLRRHRGLWVLAVAVMLIKLVAGTVCLTDGLTTKFASASTTTSITAPSVSAPTVSASDTAVIDDAAGCALGEQGDCHCACAHTATLPSTLMLAIAKVDAVFDAHRIASRFTPAVPGSLIRPPIA